MKKIFSSIMIISLLLCYSFVFVDSDDSFADIVGQSFDYEVLSSNLSIKIKRDHFSSNTYQFGNVQFFTDDPFTIDVTYANHTIAYYDFICNNISLSNFIVDGAFHRELFFNYYNTHPLLVAEIIYYDYLENGGFSDNYFENGLKLNMLFFVPANQSIWNELQALSDLFNVGYYYNTDIYQELEIVSTFNSLNDIAYFECYFQVYYQYTFHTFTQETDLFVDNCFLIAYNKTDGVLCGYRSFGSAKGRINGVSVTCDTELHLEQIGFNLPEFSLYTNIISNNPIACFTIGLTLIVVLVLVVKRRKK